MNDLTLLYYTDNNLNETCAENVRKNLLKITSKSIPIISVSQLPIDFGTNICVGEIGKSHYNCYKQILTGAKQVKTKYIACCEDDTLYNMEHFKYRPATKAFGYNNNMWYAEKRAFWQKKGDFGMLSCICETQSLIDILEPRFEKFPTEPLPRNKHRQRHWQEPGRFDYKYGVENAKTEIFRTELPLAVFNYRGSLGGKRGCWDTERIFTNYLEPFGKSKVLWEEFWP